MQKEMLKLLHIGHPGITKVKARARSTLYWPGIINQLNDLSQNCQQCQEYRNKQLSEEMLSHEIPDTPWTKVATDLFHLFKKTYLLVIDFTTNFFEISKLRNAESPTVVSHTKTLRTSQNTQADCIRQWPGIHRKVIPEIKNQNEEW